MDEIITNVKYNDIQLRERIGYGSYGVVHRAIWQTKLEIAVKIIQFRSEDSETEKNNFEKDDLREIQNLNKCIHQNIIKLYGVSKDPDNSIWLLFEYADCGSLYNFLHRTDTEVSFNEKIDWMLQCARGMEYLHKNKIVHRDLKTQNLLLFNEYRTLKICDFGTVKELATMNTEFVGTVCYMAPEVCNVQGKYTEKCDVFSFGIILWEVMSRKKPFDHLTNEHPLAIQKKIVDGVRPNINYMNTNTNSNRIQQVAEKCWDQFPHNRPSMTRLCVLPTSPLDYINVDYHDLVLNEFIGSGSYGPVMKASWQTEGHFREIAVRIIQYNLHNEQQQMAFLQKMDNLIKLRHENIVSLYGVSKDPSKSICLLYEYADCGSLYNFLHLTNKEVSFIDKLDWMLQCIKGMEYLHSKDVVHRDLKTQNLLLFNEYRILKICDFGPAATNSECIRKILYMAPEVCNGNGEYTQKCDVFSFAIILWEVISRRKPFDHFKDPKPSDIKNEIIRGDRPHIDTNEQLDQMKTIIEKCWDQDPINRPTMKELYLSLYIILQKLKPN